MTSDSVSMASCVHPCLVAVGKSGKGGGLNCDNLAHR